MNRKGRGLHLVAPPSAPFGPGGRRCQSCGAQIDPIDWCPNCMKGEPCRAHPRSPRKRADAKFCDDECRREYRASFIRDCL